MSEVAVKKISKKIVGFNVISEEDKAKAASKETVVAKVEQQLNELLDRPEMLRGSTYKVKAPIMENALYITINDIGLEVDGVMKYHPFEIFINSKDMKDFQWVVALTRVMSAVFRKGGDVTFLVEELDSVFNPSGGYFKKGGKYMHSLVAEIGEVLRQHLTMLGLIQVPGLDEHQQKLVAAKLDEFNAKQDANDPKEAGGYPANASVCPKCKTKAVIQMDGCNTCLACADSKCG